MKCIRYYRPHGGHVARVSDAQAKADVEDGRAFYAPKHWFKAARRIEEKYGDDPYPEPAAYEEKKDG